MTIYILQAHLRNYWVEVPRPKKLEQRKRRDGNENKGETSLQGAEQREHKQKVGTVAGTAVICHRLSGNLEISEHFSYFAMKV